MYFPIFCWNLLSCNNKAKAKDVLGKYPHRRKERQTSSKYGVLSEMMERVNICYF